MSDFVDGDELFTKDTLKKMKAYIDKRIDFLCRPTSCNFNDMARAAELCLLKDEFDL